MVDKSLIGQLHIGPGPTEILQIARSPDALYGHLVHALNFQRGSMAFSSHTAK